MALSLWKRRTALALALMATSALALGGEARAQEFPDRPVTLVVPFAAGGSTDVVARIIGQKMSDDLGQQVVMGTVATHALNPLILKTKPYDPEKDFAPVSLLVLVPNVLVVNPQLPVKNVDELLALLKASPDQYAYASSGNGTPLHLSGELFKKMAGVSMQHVPYKGSGPALNDVIGNQVPIMFDNLPSSSGHITSGTLKALAVTTKERAASFPDVPTIAETIPGYETYTWNALFAPAGTPKDVIDRLNASAKKALADPAVAEKMKGFSATIVASTPDELGAHVKAELAKWGPIVKEANVQMD
jgi:tripartite-type tricarboxylate transporter receptor subunit TctC